MFNSGILDVVIGLVVVYLQLSLVCTAVHELIASGFKQRARELEKGIGQLLTNPQLVEKFYSHPLIKGLRPDGKKPSYIPSRTFALTVMDIVRRHSFDGTLSMATQAVTDRTSEVATANASLEEAETILAGAQALRKATDQVPGADGTKVDATAAARDAAAKEAAAEAIVTNAQIKLAAANRAKAAAEAYSTQIKTETDAARSLEAAAVAAEDLANKSPLDDARQTAAKEAREKADEAAYRLAPSAASLLSEARDKVATAQSSVVPAELKTALLALIDNAGTNWTKAQKNLEQWFNDAMDRVSGVYKRRSQLRVVLIAAVVTIAANVDSLQVADALSRDKALRESLVAAAPALAEGDKSAVDRERGGAQPTPTATPTPAAIPARRARAASASLAQAPKPTPTPTPKPDSSASLSGIRASLEEIKKLGVPLGYIRVCTPGEEKVIETGCQNAIDAALADTELSLKKALAEMDLINARLQEIATAEAAVPVAEAAVTQATLTRDTAKRDQLTTPELKAAAELALAKAQTNLEDAKAKAARFTSQAKADTEAARQAAAKKLDLARNARDRAVKASIKSKEAEAAAVEAEATAQLCRAEAQANQTAEKESAADEAEAIAKVARRKANEEQERRRVECPKCRKESELSANELKQRLPTTHGYRLVSWDFPSAVAAFAGDSLALVYSHWLGWLLTTMAISMGAPFWFDMLNRLMVIRSTVKPSEKSKEQDSKDNPPPDDGENKTGTT